MIMTYIFICCSDSDITALAKNRAYAHINLEDMTIHQVVIYLHRCTFSYIVKAVISSILYLVHYSLKF